MYFIFVTILILSIYQLFSIKYSLIDENHVAYAESNDSANVLVPSNMNRIEITLKNDASTNVYSLLDSPFLIAIVSGLTAILGGIMGSYMTNRSHMKMEEKRDKIETQRQKKIQEEEEEKKVSIRALICSELESFSNDLDYLGGEEFWSTDISPVDSPLDYQKRLVSIMESYKMEFLKLPFELRLKLFDVDLLVLVQSAYDDMQAWIKDFLLTVNQHKGDSVESLHEAVKRIDPMRTKDDIDPVIQDLKKILPKSIVEKIES